MEKQKIIVHDPENKLTADLRKTLTIEGYEVEVVNEDEFKTRGREKVLVVSGCSFGREAARVLKQLFPKPIRIPKREPLSDYETKLFRGQLHNRKR